MLVFVYGTLKKGFNNYPVMERARGMYMGRGKTHQSYDLMDVNGVFPALIPGSKIVLGEVFDVPDLRGLDSLEGHPNFYVRTPMIIGVEDFSDNDIATETTEIAWAYMFSSLTQDHPVNTPNLVRSTLINTVSWNGG